MNFCMATPILTLEFYLVTHNISSILFGKTKMVTCKTNTLNCGLLNTSGCNLKLNWIAHVKSNGYLSHSLVTNKSEQLYSVQICSIT